MQCGGGWSWASKKGEIAATVPGVIVASFICRMYTPYFQLREEDKRIFPDYRSQNGMTNKHTRLQAVCVHCALSRKIPNRTFLRSLFDAQQIGIIAI